MKQSIESYIYFCRKHGVESEEATQAWITMRDSLPTGQQDTFEAIATVVDLHFGKYPD